MALPRSSALRGTIRSFTIRRAGTQARTNLRSIGRRTYASGHEAKKSSDIPWLIGSVAATVPAAVWLWQQGPAPSDHGHGHGHESHGKEEEAHEEESEEKDEAAESKDDSSDESKAESDDEGKSETSTDESTTESPSEDAKGSEKKGDKDSASDTSGAKNPNLDDDEKSKKGEGVAETAKIHGTVDSARPVGGQKGSDKSEEAGESDTKED